jgi:hypothetical protein
VDTSRITPCRPTANASGPSGTMWLIYGDVRSHSGASGIAPPGTGWLNSRQSSCLHHTSFIPGPACASPSNTQGGSTVRESRPPGSVRGVRRNAHPYRDRVSLSDPALKCLLYALRKPALCVKAFPAFGTDRTELPRQFRTLRRIGVKNA